MDAFILAFSILEPASDLRFSPTVFRACEPLGGASSSTAKPRSAFRILHFRQKDSAMASAYGFHNIEPQSRQQRATAGDKDKLQKDRLMARQGNLFALNYDPVNTTNLLQPMKQSALYIDEQQRFSGTAAEVEAARRREAMQRKENNIERKRCEGFYREQARWDHMESSAAKKDQYMQHRRDNGAARSNRSGEDYNIIGLNYNADAGGQNLKYQDQSNMYRNQLRATNLMSKDHSVVHNVVTGELRLPPIGVPQRPTPPASIRSNSTGW